MIGLLKVSWIKGNVKTDRSCEKNDKIIKLLEIKHYNERIIS